MIDHRNSKLKQVDNPASDAVVLSAYFCGTDVYIRNHEFAYFTEILSFYDSGCELKLPNKRHDHSQLYKQYKMSFDGNAIEYGLPGLLFGTGIDEQSQKVVLEVKRILELIEQSNKKNRIIVNAYGSSRGGITAFMLAKMLGNYPADIVEVNLAVLDPVPGNLIASADLDIFNQTLANQVMDLNDCHNLNRVICLYSYQPFPAYKFFAPLKPRYPVYTMVEEDIVFGEHADANHVNEASYVFAGPRFIQFMQECGTKYYSDTEGMKEINLPLSSSNYDELLQTNQQALLPPQGEVIIRDLHTTHGQDAHIRFKRPENENEYINLHHRFLLTGEKIAKSRGEIPLFKPTKDTLNNLIYLAKNVYDGMSDTNRSSRKGKLLFSMMDKLDNVFCEDDKLAEVITNYLRLLVSIALQCDGYDYSFFSATTSGDKLKNLLLLEEYRYFANLILGVTDHTLGYRDLLSFAGGYNAEYFNVKNRELNYEKIENTLKRA